jgi:hypothetical protein
MSFLIIMSLLNGLTLAALLFITASGLTLSFSLMRVVNLTHGALYLAGGFIGVSMINVTGSWLMALLAGGGAVAVLALLEEKFLLRWARGNDLTETLVSLSVAIIIGDLVLVIWGGYPKTIEIPAVLSGVWTIPGIGMIYPVFRIFTLGLAIFIIVALWLFLKKNQSRDYHPGRRRQFRNGLRTGNQRAPVIYDRFLPVRLFGRGGRRRGGDLHDAGGGRRLAYSDINTDRDHYRRNGQPGWNGRGCVDHRPDLQLCDRLYS